MSVYRKREANPECEASTHRWTVRSCKCTFSDRWYISYTVHGRMTREMIGSEADARKEHKARVAAIAKGQVGRRKTLKQYTEEHWPIGRSGEAHARNEACSLKKHLLPHFVDSQLSEINSKRVRDFQISLEKSGLKPPTINGILRLLKKILLDAYRGGVLPVFPAPDWPTALDERPLALELDSDEHAKFLAAFDDRKAFVARVAADRKKAAPIASTRFASPRAFGGSHRPDGAATANDYARFRASKPLFVIALETGLDRGELLDLRWRTGDAKTGVDIKAGVIVGERKKTGETFDIPITKACRAALAECERRTVDGRVFTSEAGEPFSVERVKRHFKLAKRLAGIKRRLRFKDLRHTLGCRLASAQVSDAIIGAVLGHSPRSNMARRYARPNKSAQRAAVLAALNS